MSVRPCTSERDEEIPGPHLATVDGHSTDSDIERIPARVLYRDFGQQLTQFNGSVHGRGIKKEGFVDSIAKTLVPPKNARPPALGNHSNVETMRRSPVAQFLPQQHEHFRTAGSGNIAQINHGFPSKPVPQN